MTIDEVRGHITGLVSAGMMVSSALTLEEVSAGIDRRTIAEAALIDELDSLHDDIGRLTHELAIACDALRESETKLEAARTELDRMRPVYVVAMEFASYHVTGVFGAGYVRTLRALVAACRAVMEPKP